MLSPEVAAPLRHSSDNFPVLSQSGFCLAFVRSAFFAVRPFVCFGFAFVADIL